MTYYECLWYWKTEDQTDDQAMQFGDTDSKEFKTKKQALSYYEKHKNDPDRCGWWVTKRDEDGCVIDDIIY